MNHSELTPKGTPLKRSYVPLAKAEGNYGFSQHPVFVFLFHLPIMRQKRFCVMSKPSGNLMAHRSDFINDDIPFHIGSTSFISQQFFFSFAEPTLIALSWL